MKEDKRTKQRAMLTGGDGILHMENAYKECNKIHTWEDSEKINEKGTYLVLR